MRKTVHQQREQALAQREQGSVVDFTIHTSAMELGTWHGAPVVSMIGSSTVRDLKKDVMREGAIADMAKVQPGLVIWLNHDYTLPDSLFGSLVRPPEMKRDQVALDIVDLYLLSDVELDNEAAAKTYQYVKKGRKIGCSIGCRVDKASIDEDLYEETGEVALLIDGVTPVEWSLVGVPCNQRSWVEQAVKGYVSRRILSNRFDIREAAVLKSLYPREYSALVRSLDPQVYKQQDLLTVKAAPRPTQRIVWDAGSGNFFRLLGRHEQQAVDRADLARLLKGGALEERGSVDPVDPDDEFDDDDDGDDESEAVLAGTALAVLDLDAETVDTDPEGVVNQPLPTPEATVLTVHPDVQLPAGDVLNAAPALTTFTVAPRPAKPAKPAKAASSKSTKAWTALAQSIRVAVAPATTGKESRVKTTKAAPAWGYTFLARPLPLDAAAGEAGASETDAGKVSLQPVTVSALKDGAETLSTADITARTTEVEAAIKSLSPEQKAHYESLVTDADLLQGLTRKWEKLEFKQTRKSLRQQARAAREAAAVTLLTRATTPPSSESAADVPATPAEDPIVTAKRLALQTLADDLGYTIKGRAIKGRTVSDPTKKAAQVALKAALRGFQTKSGATISEKNMGQLQLAHDALSLVTEGTVCKGGTGATDMQQQVIAGVKPGTLVATKGLDLSAITALSEALKAFQQSLLTEGALGAHQKALADKADALGKKVVRIEQMVKDLTEMPLGRPTQTHARTIVDPKDVIIPPASFDDMAKAGQGTSSSTADTSAVIPADKLLEGTEIRLVRRGPAGFEMRMRYWPDGYAKGQRPELETRVLPYMLMQDIVGYKSGGEAYVPEL